MVAGCLAVFATNGFAAGASADTFAAGLAELAVGLTAAFGARAAALPDAAEKLDQLLGARGKLRAPIAFVTAIQHSKAVSITIIGNESGRVLQIFRLIGCAKLKYAR